MKNQIIKITLTMVMLLVMAVPTQAFAAEKCDTQFNLAKNSNYSNIYDQFAKQVNKASIPTQQTKQTTPQAKQTTQAVQAPTAAPAKSTIEAPATTAVPATPAGGWTKLQSTRESRA